MRAVARLGKGACGEVSLYQTDGDGYVEAAVKVMSLDDDGEDAHGIEVAAAAAEAGAMTTRLLVPASLHRLPGCTCVVMPRADGCLPSRGQLTVTEAAALGAIVARALGTMFREGYAYCDLKPENLLVVARKGVPHLVFGDLGGLVHTRELGVCTYPPPAWPTGVNVPASEATLVWGLGVLVTTLMWGHDTDIACVKGKFTPAEVAVRVTEVTLRVAKKIEAAGGPHTPMGEFLAYCLTSDDPRLTTAEELALRASEVFVKTPATPAKVDIS